MRTEKLIILWTGNWVLVFLLFRDAIVEDLVGFGATVYTCCRNESELDGCLNEWDNFGFGVTGSVCDVSVWAQRKREELMSTVSTLFDEKLNIHVSFFISYFLRTNTLNFVFPLLDFKILWIRYMYLKIENYCLKIFVKICIEWKNK